MTQRRRRTAKEIAARNKRNSSQNMRVFLMIIIALAALAGVMMFRRGCGKQMADLFTVMDPAPREGANPPTDPKVDD